MLIGWVMPTCSSEGLAKLYGEKFAPAGSRTATPTMTSDPGGTTSFSPIVAHPDESSAVLLIAALAASSATSPSGRGVHTTNASRSMIWPEVEKLLPLRRPSTIVWGLGLLPPLRTMV